MMSDQGKSVFNNILISLEQLTGNPDKKVSKQDYEVFCKEFIFDTLKNEHSFGSAFCSKFGFNNTFLKVLSHESAKYHIERLGYIEK